MKFGRYRVDFERNNERRFRLRSGGQATPGPWNELVIPWIGSFIFSRARSRPPTGPEHTKDESDGNTPCDGDEERGG